jgi:hypothetical protein
MHRKMLPACFLTLAALTGAAGAYASLAGSGPKMGPKTTLSRPGFQGYYDGHKDTYLNTDVSSKSEAKAMHINYAPGLKAVPLKTAPEIYLVEGKSAAGQLAVFGSEPGEASYSPIWKETILTWKASATPVVIKSDTQVDQLEKGGKLSERGTSIRLNCPIIKVG